MPPAKRSRVEPTDDWQQLRLLIKSPEQEGYELLRPIVLFGQLTDERAQQTGVSPTALRRKTDRFDREGMAGLFAAPERRSADRRALPEHVGWAIRALKADYPAFRPHEIAAICRRRFDDCHVEHRTVQGILAGGLSHLAI